MRWLANLSFCFVACVLAARGIAQASDAVPIDVVIKVDLPQAVKKNDKPLGPGNWGWQKSQFDNVKSALATVVQDFLRSNHHFWKFEPQPDDTASTYQLILDVVSPDTSGVMLVFGMRYEGEYFLLGTKAVIPSDEAVTLGPLPEGLVIDRARLAFKHALMTDRATRQRLRKSVYAVPVGLRSMWVNRGKTIAVDLPSDRLDELERKQFQVLCTETVSGGGVIHGNVLYGRVVQRINEIHFDSTGPSVEALIVKALRFQEPDEQPVSIGAGNLARVGKLLPGEVLLRLAETPTPSGTITGVIASSDQ